MYQLNEDRECAILEAALDSEVRTLSNDVSRLLLEHDSNLAQAEAKLFIESGNDEDMVTLYTEAADQALEKGKGIFRRIFDAIKEFTGKVRDKIVGIFKGKEDKILEGADKNAKVEMQMDQNKANDGIGLLNKGKNLIKKILSSASDTEAHIEEVTNYVNTCEKFVKLGLAVATLGIAVKQLKDLRPKIDIIDKLSDEASKVIDTIKNPTKFNLINKIATAMSKVAKAIGSGVMGVYNKVASVAGKLKGNKETAEPPSTDDDKSVTESADDSASDFSSDLDFILNNI